MLLESEETVSPIARCLSRGQFALPSLLLGLISTVQLQCLGSPFASDAPQGRDRCPPTHMTASSEHSNRQRWTRCCLHDQPALLALRSPRLEVVTSGSCGAAQDSAARLDISTPGRRCLDICSYCSACSFKGNRSLELEIAHTMRSIHVVGYKGNHATLNK